MSFVACPRSRLALGRGFSLIELMVGITISLVVMLVIFNVLTVYEGRKRTATSVNDISQAGAFGMYTIDKAVRSGGSGFTSVWSQAYGCVLNVQYSTPATTILPAAAFPAPFDAVPGALRLAPVLIGRDQSSVAGAGDVLIVMAGTAGFGETPPRMRPSTALFALPGVTRNVQMRNTLGYRHGDLVLIGNPSSPCLLSQVHEPAAAAANPPPQGIGYTVTTAPSFTTSDQLPLGPTNAPSYFADAGVNVAMNALVTGEAYVAPIGNVSRPAGGAPANPPQFRMYAVGANQTLMTFDPLRVGAALAGTLGTLEPSTPIIDGVTEMHAVYGVDTDDDGDQDAWQIPTAGSPWAAEVTGLLAGTGAAQQRLRQIVSVRVAMVMRTSLPERDDVSPATITLDPVFGVGPIAVDTHYRYRVVDSTIPVRNNLMPQQ